MAVIELNHRRNLEPQQEALYKKYLKENNGPIPYVTDEEMSGYSDPYYSSYEKVFREAFFNELD